MLLSVPPRSRPPRLRLQQERQEAALCAAGAAAGPPQPQPQPGGATDQLSQDQSLHPGAAPRHHGPGPRQALPALREDRLHQSHPGQDDQQVQRLRLRRLRQPHGGPEGRDGAQGQRGAGADGQATGAGPHQPLHLEPAAGGGRAGAGGAAEALRAGGLDPHPAGPPRGQPRCGLCTDGVNGEVRGRHHPLQREVHQDPPGGSPGPAALQVRGRGAEEAAEPGQVRAQRESLGPGRRHGHRDLGLRPRDGAAEWVGSTRRPTAWPPSRMIAPTALAPYLPSPVSSYQVHGPAWMHQSYLVQPTGAVLAPAVDHAVPLQPSVVAPLAQQLGHLSLGSAGTYVPAAAAVPGAFIPPYPPVPPALPLEDGSAAPSHGPIESPSEPGAFPYPYAK
ncbi:unnamed protein product [Bubo scandiacus]